MSTKEKKAPKFKMPFIVFKQEWVESERGWGVRPDGYSLHLFQVDRVKFVTDYLDEQHKSYLDRGGKDVPDTYSKPGAVVAFDTDEKTYKLLLKKRKKGILGLWFS